MTGILLDGGAIVVGGLFGMLLKKFSRKMEIDGWTQVLGIMIIFISVVGIAENMLMVDNGMLACRSLIPVLVCVVVGSVAGGILRLENKTHSIVQRIEKTCGMSALSGGLVSCTVFFGIGALQIVGPINSMLLQDNTLLITKSMVDFPFAVFYGSLFGLGVMLSALPVVAGQVAIALFAGQLRSILGAEFLAGISAVSYVIFLCSGFNLMFKKSINIPIVNLLPALFLMAGYQLVQARI